MPSLEITPLAQNKIQASGSGLVLRQLFDEIVKNPVEYTYGESLSLRIYDGYYPPGPAPLSCKVIFSFDEKNDLVTIHDVEVSSPGIH